MIRPLTCLCLAAAFASGLYLYSEKHRAEMLDRKIGGVVMAAQAARARTMELQTEWAMLNEPSRLQDIASKYLPQLQPLSPGQFVQSAELTNRLPAPEAPQPDTVVDEEVSAPVPVAGDPVPPQADLPPIEPAPRPISHAPAKMLAKTDSKPRHVQVADRDRVPTGALAHGTMLPLASPQPMHASVMSAMAHPLPRARPAIIRATPSYAAPAYIGSAIATGRSALPPPVPLGAGE
jgi:hypothetical protein